MYRGVEAEDDGVIDLFAIHQRATASPAQEVAPDLFSAPPPAFTTDLYGDTGENSALDEDGNPFAKNPRKKLAMIGAAAAAGLVLLVVVVASLSGGAPERTAKTTAARSESAPPPAAVAPPITAPVVVATPSASSTHVPAPPTTGAPAAVAAPPRAGRASVAKARPPVASGPKLTKIQSAGVAGK